MALAFSLAFACQIIPGRAQLGESEQAIRHRLGTPTAVQRETSTERSLTFEKPGVLTVVDFRGDKCVRVAVTKIGGALTSAELQRVLRENGAGKTWAHDKIQPELWRRDDGVLAYAETGFISIVMPDEERKLTGSDIGDKGAPNSAK